MADTNTDNNETPASRKGLGWGLAAGALGGLGIAALLVSGLWTIVGAGLLCGAAYSAYKVVKPNKEPVASITDTLDTGLNEHNASPEPARKKSPEQALQEDMEVSEKAPRPLKRPESPAKMEEPQAPRADFDSVSAEKAVPSAGRSLA